MIIVEHPKKSDWEELIQRSTQNIKKIKKIVKPIIKQVKRQGDKALFKFSSDYDHVELESILVSEQEIAEYSAQVSTSLKKAIKVAKNNIEKFHKSQSEVFKLVETMPGIECYRKSVAIEKVGLYVPGGTAPLFSTVLMLAIPATLAGCQEIIMCTPPAPDGRVNPVILYTARLCGVTKIAKVGGAQAIAALAYGTQSIPFVYKIFGPGNQYVTAAKQVVNSKGVAIDMLAGPSEVAIFADSSSNPVFVAADMLSQTEHGTDSQAFLVTTDKSLINHVKTEIETQLKSLPRKEMIVKSLQDSKIILVNDEKEAMEILNAYAPEHLVLATDNADTLAQEVINAGSVFLGHYAPESAGDYASGTNHTLPTNGFAKAYSGVSLDSFVKKITFQRISNEGLKRIAPYIEEMTTAEKLHAHKKAVTLRLK